LEIKNAWSFTSNFTKVPENWRHNWNTHSSGATKYVRQKKCATYNLDWRLRMCGALPPILQKSLKIGDITGTHTVLELQSM